MHKSEDTETALLATRQEVLEDLALNIRERARLLDHKQNWVKATNEAIKQRDEMIANNLAVLARLDRNLNTPETAD